MTTEKLTRLDSDEEIRRKILPHCRIQYGDIWEDKISGHRIGCLSADDINDGRKLMGGKPAVLAVQDPPYNIIVGNKKYGKSGENKS